MAQSDDGGNVAVLACHYKTLYSYSSNISLNDPPKEPTDIPIIIADKCFDGID